EGTELEHGQDRRAPSVVRGGDCDRDGRRYSLRSIRGRQGAAGDEEDPGPSASAQARRREASTRAIVSVVHHLGARPAVRERAAFTPLLRAELLLSLRGRPTAWWLVALGLFLGECFSPIHVARAWVLPFAWIWPLLVWSDLGGREQRYQTVSLIFTSPRPVVRPALATWVVGILVAIAAGLPVGVRLAVSWDFAGLAAWSSGALFIPAFALAAGTWTGGGKLFEGLYTFLWYAGPLQHVPLFD